MNKDVSSILDLIGQLSESVTTPVDVNHGLNAQQKSVPQLPADARARKTSVLATKKDPKHPFAGYMVGSDESVETDEKPVEEGLRDPEDNPCWSGYHPIGTKKKAGRTVPNCVPNESINEVTAPPSFNRQLQDKLYQDYAPGYGEPFHQGHVDNIIKMATTNQWQEYLKSNGKLPWVTALVDREKKEWNTWHEKKAAEIAADNTARKAAGTYGVTLPEINQRVAKKLAVWLATQLEAHGHDADVEEILDQTFDAGHTPSGIEYYESSYETFFAYVGLLGGNKLTKPILMHSDAAGEMETVNKHKGAIYNISGPHNGMSILTRMTGPRYGSIPIDIPNDPNTPIYELDAGSNGGDDNEGQNWEVIAKDPDPNKLLGMLLDLLWGNTIPNELGESLSPFNDDHSELDQFVKEEFNREIDEEVTERQISVRRLADVIINEILRNKDALRTYGQDKILRAASSVASEWVDRKFSKEHLPVMVKSAMDKISSNQLDEFDASGFSERYTMYCDNDVFGRYEDVDDALADAQQMMNDDYRMKGCFWVLKDISGETVWSQEPGDIIDAARMRHKMRFIDPGKDLEEDRDQPVNQGWNDFTVDGYRYEPWEEEEFDRDNKKIHHSVRTPAGEVVSVDWDPYEYMEPGDLKSWIDLGMPTRQHAGTIGPLRADHLDKLAAQKKTVDETSFADAGEVVGGIVGGPAAFALARGRGGKKTYAAGSVAGSAIGNAAGRWIDNKLAPAAGVDQHGPGPIGKRYTKPIDESPETLYFFDVANTTGSYTDQQLRALGLRQTRSGKWYYKPIGNNAQAVDAIAQRLNVQPKPWTPVREGNPAADWPIFGESQDNTVASHTFADTGDAFRNGQQDAMNFRPKNDAKYIRGHKYRSNYSDGYKYGLTQQDRSINPKTGQPYVLFGPNGPTNDSDPERSMHGDGPHVWVCSSYRQAKKRADDWGQKVVRAGVSKWKVVPKDDPAPEIFSESDLNEVTGDKSFDSMMGNIVKGARYKGAKADQQADTAYGNMIQGITNNTNAVRQPSTNSKFEQIYNQVERILLSSHIHSEIDYDIMDALKKLKIKTTDKLIQKLESALVSRVSDALKFYDESDLEEQGVSEGIETKIRAKNQAVVKKLQNTEVKEDITQEDIITKLKAKLGDYLSDLGQQIKKDPALKDKLADKPRDTMGPAVKTVTTDDGQTISIHGNEDDGFRISIKNKPATAKFKTVDEAALACNMFNARRKNPRINTDYVDEA